MGHIDHTIYRMYQDENECIAKQAVATLLTYAHYICWEQPKKIQRIFAYRMR